MKEIKSNSLNIVTGGTINDSEGINSFNVLVASKALETHGISESNRNLANYILTKEFGITSSSNRTNELLLLASNSGEYFTNNLLSNVAHQVNTLRILETFTDSIKNS